MLSSASGFDWGPPIPIAQDRGPKKKGATSTVENGWACEDSDFILNFPGGALGFVMA